MKLIDFYYIKDNDLWLTSDLDTYGNYLDNSPKAIFLLAIDWFIGYEKPYMTIKTEPKIYYKLFTIKLYLIYYQLGITFRLGKMPYRSKEEYLKWRKNI